jgi:hypothetical protein
MKALEKDRNRRYETANGFAMDVQRYLADEPVLACPPSAAYRLRKFVRRHQAGIMTTAALLLVVLLAGGGIGWMLWERAVQQWARRATTEQTVSVALGRAAELSEQAQKMPNASSVEAKAVLAPRPTSTWVTPSNRRRSFARPWRSCAAVTNSVRRRPVRAMLRPNGSGSANA